MVNKWPSSQTTGGSPGSLRKVHRALALREIALNPGISRIDLARGLGLSFMAVSRIVNELEEASLLLNVDAANGVANIGRGRPAGALHLHAQGAFVIGASISAFSQEIVLADLTGQPVARADAHFDDINDGPATVRQACAVIRDLIDRCRVPIERIVGAGFAVAANVDADSAAILPGGYLGWRGFDLRALAEPLLEMPVTVNRLADALLRAESFDGCARHRRAPVLIHCATILGASFIANGALATGANHLAGRIGHYPIRATRLLCSCGQSDCLNCSASGWSILHRLRAIEHPAYQPDRTEQYSRLTRALAQGDLAEGAASPRYARAMREAGLALAKALRYVELTLNPDLIVLAGPLATNEVYYRGVLKGLQSAGAASEDVTLKLARSTLTPSRSATAIALLDAVFSTSLDLVRIGRSTSTAHYPGSA